MKSETVEDPKLTMNDCDSLRDLLPAYSIGATDPEETAMLQAKLKECPELAAELDHYAQVSAALAQAVPVHNPPPELLGNLLQAARQSQPLRRWRFSWAALAACLALLLVVSNLFWAVRLNAETLRQVDLPSAANELALNASGRVLWRPDQPDGLLLVQNFPPSTAETIYQAWVRRGERIESLGIFDVDARGRGILIFPTAALHEPFDTLGVTLEPAGGSPGPSSAPLIRWRA